MSAKATLERVVDGTLARSPVQAWFRRLTAGRLAILAYHGVDDEERFARQLDWLVRNTHPLTLDELIAATVTRRRLPQHPVLLTFDDGHRSLLDMGFPLLRERGLPGVAFVVAGLVGSQKPLWWAEATARWRPDIRIGGRGFTSADELVRWLKRVPDDDRRQALAELRPTVTTPPAPAAQLHPHELVQLEAGGVAVGNHSLTHPCLPRCEDDRIAHEVEESHRRLTGWLGHEPRSFAYPNGDTDARAVAAVARAGYEVGFLFDHRFAPLPARDPLRMSRLRVNSTTSPDRFRTIVSGIHPALHRLRGGS